MPKVTFVTTKIYTIHAILNNVWFAQAIYSTQDYF